MTAVTRLVTSVDINDDDDAGPHARRMALSARHEAVLADGRRVVLLDRGWSSELRVFFEHERSPQERAQVEERMAIWAYQTVEEIERTARDVVGPDEPSEGDSPADVEAGHWAWLARVLREEGVEADGAELKGLPHDVELSESVLARIAEA